MTATHPTDRELHDFLLGKLADSHFGEVESHLADCPECGRRALAAPADDTLTELLAAARTRLDSDRALAPTPTLDATATPSLAAPTLTWGGSAPGPDGQTEAPAVLANHPKYRVVRRLGTGGMGTVWLAEHQVMHRPVAVKVIRPDLLARPGATGRFLREVRAAAKLHHPNIVTAFDAEPAGDSCLLVMEYVPGQTLGERLEAGPLPVAEACRAVRDAARGLAHAHSHGLVHRDVKPHNLIRAADGTTKVLDFGLAGVVAGEVPAASGDGLTGAGMVVGTPDYIAPEQIADPHAADARADIYGLGCTLYHLLAGRPPLPVGSVAEKLAAQPTHQPDPIPGLPPGLAEVLAKMMAKRPEDRYQTADELIAALEPFSGPLAPRAGPARGASRPRYRRWLAIAAGVLIGLAIGVIIKIERDNQVIEVRTNDPDIEVVMKRKGEVLRVIDKKSGQEWTIDTEKNEIAQADAPGGLTVSMPGGEPFVLRRNGRDVFTVTRVPKPAAPAPAPETTTGPRLVRMIDHGHPVRDVAWTPDGQSVVAVGGGLCRYDVVKGRSGFKYRYEVLSRLPGLKGNLNTEGPTQMVVSDDGRTAVIVYGNTVGRFSLADGRALGFQQLPEQGGKAAPVTALAVSPDGRTAVCAAGDGLAFQELGKAGEPKPVKLTAPGPVVALRYSPAGGFLVAAAAHPVGSRTELIVLDARTHEVVRRHTLAGMLGQVDISHDDTRLVAAGGVGNKGGFTVLTLPDLQVVRDEAEVAGFVEAARLSADGKLLTLERAPGAVEVWDVERKVRVSDQPLPADPTKAGDAPVRHVAIAPDGRSVAVARGNEIGIWELPSAPAASPTAPRLVRTIEDGRRFPQTPAFTPDGKALLVAGFDYFAVYDPATGKELFSDQYESAEVNTLLAVSADGRTAAVACGNVFLYDLAGRKRAVTIDMEIKKFVQITALTLSPDGQRLAYVAGREIVYCDRATGQTEYTRPDDDKVRVIAVRYTPDGRYLVVESQIESDKKSPVILQDAKTRVSVLDAKTRALVGRHELPGLWGQARLSGDGGRVFIGGPVAGKPGFVVLKLPECEEIERDVDLPAGMPIPSPDGRLLALTGRDGDVQVWDRGQKRVTFAWNPHPNLPPEFKPAPGRKAAPPRTGIAFSPDGRTLATARGDEIKVWELAPAAPKTDLDHLQGTWLAVSGEHAGKPWDAAAAKTTRLVFDGEVFHFTFPFPKDLFNPKGGDRPETTSGTFTLDPTKKPGVITLIGEEGDGVLVQGIYRLEGEQLTLCLGKPGHDRPRDFKSQAGGENTLLVLRRATDPAPNRGTERPDSKLILGTWRGVAAEVGGQPLPKEFIDTVKPTLTFTADKAVGKPEGTFPKPLLALATAQGLLPKEAAAVLEKGVEGVYRLDSTKSPKTIDITWLGEVKKAGLGIYQLDGDTLKLCLSIDPAQVDQRPTEFATRAGEMRVLLTLRRLTPEEVILEDVERRIDPAKGDGKSLPVALLEHRGVAALRFGKWRLVFEGVPCDARGRVVFGIRFFYLPEAGGEPVVGPPGLEMPAPALRQQWDGRRNTIALDKYRFVMEGKGKRLVFGDKAYEATDRVQTVVIARDGTTRLEPPAAKK